MDPMLLGAIGAGVGLGKSYLIDKPAEWRDRKLQALTALYSPWTGMRPEAVKEAKPFDSALQYGGTGLSMGQNMENQSAWKKLMDAKTKQAEAEAAKAASGQAKPDNVFEEDQPMQAPLDRQNTMVSGDYSSPWSSMRNYLYG